MLPLFWHKEIGMSYKKVIRQVKRLYASTLPPSWLGQIMSQPSLEATVSSSHTVDVSDEGPDSIAGQFYLYMPGHGFKVQYLIDQLSPQHSLPLFVERACLAVVDIGCGGATASTALINAIIQKAAKDTRFLFVGLDINLCAVQLFDWMMHEHKSIPLLKERIDHHAVIKGMPEALTYAAEGLYQAKNRWKIPSLSDVWIIQSNVVRPLQWNWEKDKKARNLLGLDANGGLIPNNFGEVEARAYEQILQLTQADRMLILTVANNDETWKDSTSNFGDSVAKIFTDKGHKPDRLHQPHSPNQPFKVSYRNPEASYWYGIKGNKPYTGQFYADVQYIESERFLADQMWQEVISENNLKLAWARVRAAMMRDSLVDEVDIRLFDLNLLSNLQHLRNRLLTYTMRLTDLPRIFYEVPKDGNTTRPRALQSVHEEILAVAIIQVFGRDVQELISRNYGYRLNYSGSTEYLYRPWFRAYGRFRNVVRKAIRGNEESSIVHRSDIANFYPSISQDELFNAVLAKFHLRSTSRAAWLIHQLIIRNQFPGVDDGVLQGPLASGFWANLYLLALDQKFSDEYLDASFFRYVDDLILIIHSKTRESQVKQDLQDQIEDLKLSLSDDKTETEPVSIALARLEKDKILDELDKNFRKIVEGFYIIHPEDRDTLQAYDGATWWKYIQECQQRLKNIGIFIEAARLSRKIWQHVKNPLLAANHFYLTRPFRLHDDVDSWVASITDETSSWKTGFEKTKGELSQLLRDKWEEWKQLKLTNPDGLDEKNQKAALKKIQTYLSFILNRLTRLGYDDVLVEIEEIICVYPFALKSHRFILEHLAIQNHLSTLISIWTCLQTATFPGSAYLRALVLRCARTTDLTQTSEFMRYVERIAVQTLADASPIEGLMASETLLFLPDYVPTITMKQAFLQQAALIQDQCPQLARNLRMLVHKGEAVVNYYEKYGYALEDLYSLGKQDDRLTIPDFQFEELEPDLLRRDYYHSRYPDNADEFEGDYF